MKTALSYGLVYLLWAITLPLGGLMIIDLRDTILTLMAISAVHRVGQNVRAAFYANLELRAADTTSWLLVGILLVIMIIIVENVYRIGMLGGRLWSRFFLVMAIIFGVVSLSNFVTDLLRLEIGGFTWRGLFGPVIYLVLAGTFFWSYGRAGLKENTPSSDEGQ